MIALLLLIILLGIILFLARERLQKSPFRENWFLSWGTTIEAPALLAKIFGKPLSLPDPGTKLPADIMQFPPAYLAMLINRDHLCRPLMAAIVDLAVRGLVKLNWKSDTEELMLVRLPVSAEDVPNKLDRALISKLFPNEALELPIEWRHSSILGDARRLLLKAYEKKAVPSRLGLNPILLLVIVMAIIASVIVIVATSEVGFVSLFMPLMLAFWPMFSTWAVCNTMRARALYKIVPAERFMARLFIFAAFTGGILLSGLIMVLVTAFAFGIIRALVLIAIGLLLMMVFSWVRPAAKLTKAHQVSATLIAALKNRERLHKDADKAVASLNWKVLAPSIALGREQSWIANGQLHVAIDDEPDADGEAEPDNQQQASVDPDNPSIALPETLALGGKKVPLETVEQLLGSALWFDLWLALSLDRLMNISGEIENFRSNLKLAKSGS